MSEKQATQPAEPAIKDSDPAPSSAAPDASADALAELVRERDELQDRLLRKSAEFDNYRKRIERERREQGDQSETGVHQGTERRVMQRSARAKASNVQSAGAASAPGPKAKCALLTPCATSA
jgi:predicted phage gp36 major capsid-like protein